jgi:hypothetical protein
VTVNGLMTDFPGITYNAREARVDLTLYRALR